MELLSAAKASAEIKPHALAIQYQGIELSWSEFFDTASRLGTLFHLKGVKPGQVVASTGFSAILQTVIVAATWHQAAISTVLPVGFFEAPTIEPDWVISPSPIELFAHEKQIVIDELTFGSLGNVTEIHAGHEYPLSSSICHLMFSSGTTGTNKAIPYSVDRVVSRARVTSEKWRENRPFMTSLGFRSASGFNTFAEALLSGNPYLIAEGTSELITMLKRHRVRNLLASPLDLANLALEVQREHLELPHLTTIQSTGSLISNQLRDRLEELTGAMVWNMYGSSEVGFVAIGKPGDSDTGFVGNILEDVQLEVVDSESKEVPQGTVGEVRMRRAGQPEELFGDEGRTSTVFKDGWFYPGEFGYLELSQLFILGRTNELLNAGGVKVLASEVENAVSNFPGVLDSAALTTESPEGIPLITALYVSLEEIDSSALINSIAGRLGERIPRRLVRVEQIPRNANGKILRDKLRELIKD